MMITRRTSRRIEEKGKHRDKNSKHEKSRQADLLSLPTPIIRTRNRTNRKNRRDFNTQEREEDKALSAPLSSDDCIVEEKESYSHNKSSRETTPPQTQSAILFVPESPNSAFTSSVKSNGQTQRQINHPHTNQLFTSSITNSLFHTPSASKQNILLATSTQCPLTAQAVTAAVSTCPIPRLERAPQSFDRPESKDEQEEEMLLSPLNLDFLFESFQPSQPVTFANFISPKKIQVALEERKEGTEEEQRRAEEEEEGKGKRSEIEEEDGEVEVADLELRQLEEVKSASDITPPVSTDKEQSSSTASPTSAQHLTNPLPLLETPSAPTSGFSSSSSSSSSSSTLSPKNRTMANDLLVDEEQERMAEIWNSLNLFGDLEVRKSQLSLITTFATPTSPLPPPAHPPLPPPPAPTPVHFNRQHHLSPPPSQFSIRLSQPTPRTPPSPVNHQTPLSNSIPLMEHCQLPPLLLFPSPAVDCSSPGASSATSDTQPSVSSDMPTQLTNTFAAMQQSQLSPSTTPLPVLPTAADSSITRPSSNTPSPPSTEPAFLPPIPSSNEKITELRGVTRVLREEFEQARDPALNDSSSLTPPSSIQECISPDASASTAISDNPFVGELPIAVNEIAVYVLNNKNPTRLAVLSDDEERKYEDEEGNSEKEERRVETPKSASSALRSFYQDSQPALSAKPLLPPTLLSPLRTPAKNIPHSLVSGSSRPLAPIVMSEGVDDEEEELMVAIAEEAEAKARRQKLEQRNAARKSKLTEVQQRQTHEIARTPYSENPSLLTVNPITTPLSRPKQKAGIPVYHNSLPASFNVSIDSLSSSSSDHTEYDSPLSLPNALPSLFGFQTAKGTAVKISTAALKRSADLFEKLNAEYEKENMPISSAPAKPPKELTSLSSLLANKNQPMSVTTPAPFNRPRSIPTSDSSTPLLSPFPILSESSSNEMENNANCGFKTANGHKVQVSATALERVAALFQTFAEDEDDIRSSNHNKRNQKQSTDQPQPTLLENMQQHSNILSNPAPSSFQTPRPYLKVKETPVHAKCDEDFNYQSGEFSEELGSLPSPPSDAFVGFQTGKGKKVEISSASIVRAAALFDPDTGDDIIDGIGMKLQSGAKRNKLHNSSFPSSMIDAQQSLSNSTDEFRSGFDSNPLPGEDAISFASVGFTSGKGKKIIPSDASLKRAHAILCDLDNNAGSEEIDGRRMEKKQRLEGGVSQEQSRTDIVSVTITPRLPKQRPPLATLQAVNGSNVNAINVNFPIPPADVGPKPRPFISPRPLSSHKKNKPPWKDNQETLLKRKNMDQTRNAIVNKGSEVLSVPPSLALPATPFSAKQHPTTRSFSASELKALGVSPDIVSINSLIAQTYQFSSSTASLDYKTAHRHLLQLGCQSKLLDEAWVKNAWRWIVWKLASYECTYPQELANRCLTYPHVLRQIKKRYERECVNVKYPAIRGLLEEDDGCESHRYMVLAIADIFLPRTKTNASTPARSEPNKTEELSTSFGGVCHIELTDGWYSIPAKLDTHLYSLLTMHQLFVGQKLRIMHARLLSTASSDSPPPATTPLENTTNYLALTINGVRHASMHAKLGFVRNTLGFVVNLQSVVSDGGIIPALSVCVYRVYPLLYMEKRKVKKSSDGGPQVESRPNGNDSVGEGEENFEMEKIHRNQKAEDLAQDEWIKQMEKKMEEKLAKSEKQREEREQVEDIEESSSQEGKSEQETKQSSYSANTEEVEARNVVPYMKVLLREVVPPESVSAWRAREQKEIEETDEEVTPTTAQQLDIIGESSDNIVFSGKECYYTIWRPSETEEETFIEGRLLTLYGAAPSASYAGSLRLSSRNSHAIPTTSVPLVTSIYRRPILLPTLVNMNRWDEFDAVLICVLEQEWELGSGKKRRILFCVSNDTTEMLCVEVMESDQMKHLPTTLHTPTLAIMTSLKNQSFDGNLNVLNALTTNDSLIKIKAFSPPPTQPPSSLSLPVTSLTDKKPRRSLLPTKLTTPTAANINTKSSNALNPNHYLETQCQALDQWYNTNAIAHQLIKLQRERAISITGGEYEKNWIQQIENILNVTVEQSIGGEVPRLDMQVCTNLDDSSLSLPPLECASEEKE